VLEGGQSHSPPIALRAVLDGRQEPPAHELPPDDACHCPKSRDVQSHLGSWWVVGGIGYDRGLTVFRGLYEFIPDSRSGGMKTALSGNVSSISSPVIRRVCEKNSPFRKRIREIVPGEK